MESSIFAVGASLHRDFITELEEKYILETIHAAEWSPGLRRRVQQYGYSYDYTSRSVSRGRKKALPFPTWTKILAERLVTHFDGAMADQCIVNEYLPGQGIGMHSDSLMEFGPVIASVSLGNSWPMRFRPTHVCPYRKGGISGDEVVVLPRRSVLILKGEARSEWMHGICQKDSRKQLNVRISATFRTMKMTRE